MKNAKKNEVYIEPYHENVIDKWCRRFTFIIGISLICFWFLFGCAVMDGYWIKSHNPVLIQNIVIVPFPCGEIGNLECANYSSGNIEIKEGIDGAAYDCLVSHAKKHFAGYSHDARKGFSIDCGDGTMMTIRVR